MKIKTNSRHLNAVYRYVYTKKMVFAQTHVRVYAK